MDYVLILAVQVVLNPATAPRSTDYFGFADLIVTAQNDFTGFEYVHFSLLYYSVLKLKPFC